MIKVLRFTAPWCGPCKTMVPVFDQLKKEFPDVTFEAINVDENGDLTQAYSISGIPTMVFLKDDKEAYRLTGAQIKANIVNYIKKLR